MCRMLTDGRGRECTAVHLIHQHHGLCIPGTRMLSALHLQHANVANLMLTEAKLMLSHTQPHVNGLSIAYHHLHPPSHCKRVSNRLALPSTLGGLLDTLKTLVAPSNSIGSTFCNRRVIRRSGARGALSMCRQAQTGLQRTWPAAGSCIIAR